MEELLSWEEFKEVYTNWIMFRYEKADKSGWKLHIFGTTLEDSYDVMTRIDFLCRTKNIMYKVAHTAIMERAIGNPEHMQYGKICAIYLPNWLFHDDAELKLFIEELMSTLDGYKPKGSIQGDMMLTDNIGYRYELGVPVDPKKGANYFEYNRWYRDNDGDYNIKGNPDPFTDLKLEYDT